jgi:predicted kinase
MSTAILTVGAPASGKSTWARENAVDLNAAIVCRDDIRIMQGLKHGDNEDLVTVVEQALIEGLISEGKDFIVADTNINKKFRNRLIKFCHQRGADVELVVFDVPLDELIRRDFKRDAQVGPDVIMRMHNDLKGQQLKSESLPVQEYAPYEHGLYKDFRQPAIVIDIDGTVARHHNRNPYDYSKVGDDHPIHDVIGIVTTLTTEYFPVFVSGRDDICYEDTANWIERNMGIDVRNPNEARLIMRKTGDQRPDWQIKNEIYDAEVIPRYNICMVFDDRDQVVYHLRRRGITVAQVAPGRF